MELRFLAPELRLLDSASVELCACSIWSDERPAGFVGFEEVYGVGFMMPVHVAAMAAFGWAWANRAALGMRAAAVTLGACLCSSLFAAGILFSWAWACSAWRVTSC